MMSLIVPTVLLRVLSVGCIPIMAPDLEGGVGVSFSARFRRLGGSKKGFSVLQRSWCKGAATMIVGTSLVWVEGSKREAFLPAQRYRCK